MAVVDDFANRAHDIGLSVEIHRQVRLVPITEHAQANEILALVIDLLVRVIAAGLAKFVGIDLDADLAEAFAADEEVTPDILRERGLIKKRCDEIKILGDGSIDKALKVSAHRFSASAKEKITAAGGSVTEVQAKRTPKQRVADLANQKK